MNKKNLLITTAILLVVIIAAAVWFIFNNPQKATTAFVKTEDSLVGLAKCLTAKKVVMYGAYWCPHCQKQKKDFGDAFKYVTYVECTKDIKKCTDEKIEGYPTWVFADGSRATGEQSLEELADKSSCVPAAASKSTVSSTQKSFSPASRIIPVEQAKQRIEKNNKLVLLDVRTEAEYKEGHLAGSTLLPVDDLESKAAKVLPDKKAEILVYCRTGNRSKRAIGILHSKGYTNLTDMQGGIAAWQSSGYPVVTE